MPTPKDVITHWVLTLKPPGIRFAPLGQRASFLRNEHRGFRSDRISNFPIIEVDLPLLIPLRTFDSSQPALALIIQITPAHSPAPSPV